MRKIISIPFCANGCETAIRVEYSVNTINDLHTIACIITTKEDKSSVQLHNFELRSRFDNGMYEPLFDEQNYRRSDTSQLFIDRTYSEIMKHERLQILVQAL